MKKIAILIFICVYGFANAQPSVSLIDTVIVTAVHDIDTYRVKYKDGTYEWIRIEHANGPEVISPWCNKHQPFGVYGGNLVRSFLKGKTVTILKKYPNEFAKTVCAMRMDTIDITEYLIANGFAWYDPGKGIPKVYADYLKNLQKAAKKNKFGLWGVKGRKIHPVTWRKKHRWPQGMNPFHSEQISTAL